MFKKVLIEKSVPVDTIDVADVEESYQPIFAKREGRLTGMIVKDGKGWITRVGGERGASGYHKTLVECIRSAEEDGHEFFIDV